MLLAISGAAVSRTSWSLCGRTLLTARSPARGLFSKTGQWEEKFNKDVRLEVESYWKDKINSHRSKTARDKDGLSKFYVLSMFPYPSGKLHMGHVRVYTISDTMARYHRLQGQYVIHPMGWDAFGLPAENAAIERGEKPDKWTYSNIENMRQQLDDLCCDFDWNREFATCDPQYYKWTQYIFLKMFEAGLVYQKEAPVNWDPVDQTVLADEQIDENGCSWRSGALVEKRNLKQWYIRTTAYSKALVDGLSEVDADLWRDIISLQKHWIGTCDGVRFEFHLQDDSGSYLDSILSVFTKTPEAVYGVSHICLSPSHVLNDPKYYKDAATHDACVGIELNIVAVHPFTKACIPVFVTPSREFGEHLDADLGIPSVCEADLEFAACCGLPYIEVYDRDTGHVINSDKFSGLSVADAFTAVADSAKELRCGYVTSEKARDWLISRQRYWGTPIPIIHCQKYGAMPVPYEDLPVTLPEVTQFRGQGVSPLASAEQWLKVKCPKCDCDGFGRRETDTMDTFVDSSWYFLRYLDSTNDQELMSSDAAKLMPVDLYIGGKEHAIMHLYYARFVNHFLCNIGVVPTREPFVDLLTQGMVMGRSYRVKETGRYLRQDEIDFSGQKPVERGTGAPLIVDWEKMSKSKFNGVDPEEVLETYGADSTRLCILSNVAPKSDRPWSNDVFVGVLRWQSRIWNLVSSFISAKNSNASCDVSSEEFSQYELQLFNLRNFITKEVTFHMEKTFLLNTAIARLQSLTNVLKKFPPEFIGSSHEFERSLAELIIMIAPCVPMFASELWAGLASAPNKSTNFHWADNVLDQQWPALDPDYRLSMTVKLNGREVFDVQLPMPFGETEALTQADALLLAQQHNNYSTVIGSSPLTGHRLQFDRQSLRVDLDLFVETTKKSTNVQKMG